MRPDDPIVHTVSAFALLVVGVALITSDSPTYEVLGGFACSAGGFFGAAGWAGFYRASVLRWSE